MTSNDIISLISALFVLIIFTRTNHPPPGTHTLPLTTWTTWQLRAIKRSQHPLASLPSPCLPSLIPHSTPFHFKLHLFLPLYTNTISLTPTPFIPYPSPFSCVFPIPPAHSGVQRDQAAQVGY